MDFDWNALNLNGFEKNFLDEDFKKRLKKTLYYGKSPLSERPSLPVTELAVELLQHAAPKQIGKLDTQLASSISRKACISPCSLMLGLIYIDRLRQKSPEYLQQISSADLFVVAMMVASKFLYDEGEEEGVYNDEWAESAGIPTDEVNSLERDFLRALDWNLLARSWDFEQKLRELEEKVALIKGKERLWMLSYTDMWVLFRNLRCLQLMNDTFQQIMKIVGVAASAYIMGFVVLLASVSLVTAIRNRLILEMTSISLPSENSIFSIGSTCTWPSLGISMDRAMVLDIEAEHEETDVSDKFMPFSFHMLHCKLGKREKVNMESDRVKICSPHLNSAFGTKTIISSNVSSQETLRYFQV